MDVSKYRKTDFFWQKDENKKIWKELFLSQFLQKSEFSWQKLKAHFEYANNQNIWLHKFT